MFTAARQLNIALAAPAADNTKHHRLSVTTAAYVTALLTWCECGHVVTLLEP
jgi:hypothetical protein